MLHVTRRDWQIQQPSRLHRVHITSASNVGYRRYFDVLGMARLLNCGDVGLGRRSTDTARSLCLPLLVTGRFIQCR